jgi:hypothetical protein
MHDQDLLKQIFTALQEIKEKQIRLQKSQHSLVQAVRDVKKSTGVNTYQQRQDAPTAFHYIDKDVEYKQKDILASYEEQGEPEIERLKRL